MGLDLLLDGIVAITWKEIIMYCVGINVTEILPLLLFIGIGALLDFGPLLSNPILIFIRACICFFSWFLNVW